MIKVQYIKLKQYTHSSALFWSLDYRKIPQTLVSGCPGETQLFVAELQTVHGSLSPFTLSVTFILQCSLPKQSIITTTLGWYIPETCLQRLLHMLCFKVKITQLAFPTISYITI